MPKAETPQRAQRNFLGDFDAMLSALSLDYVDCSRYETSGYADFIGRLYTMNSGMFQSPIYCDHMLTQMAIHYLTWFQDPALRLHVGPNAAWHVDISAWKLQRLGDELYVLAAPANSGIVRGERIVAVNGMSLDEIREEVERTLRTTVSPADPEREDWSIVLAFANHATVVDAKGEQRRVHLVPGESAVTDRMRKVYAERAAAKQGEASADEASEQAAGIELEGAGVEAAAGAGELEGADESAAAEAAELEGKDDDGVAEVAWPACSFRLVDGVAVLRVARVGDAEFAAQLEEAKAGLRLALSDGGAKGIVIDVRDAWGGVQEDAYKLVDLVLAPGTRAKPADVFGKSGIVLNCSRRNVDSKLGELRVIRRRLEASGATEEDFTYIDDLMAELDGRRGKGAFVDESDYYGDVTFESVQQAGEGLAVAVLVDRDTCDAAEWLVRAAKAAGYARIVGRATRGSIDNTCPRSLRLDGDFQFTFPTARYLSAEGEFATLGKGIRPDVHLAWSPEQLERDVDLDGACRVVLGE